jgi:hypothetical protein
MARVVPAHESRVRTTRSGDGLRIEVGRRRPWWRILLPVWVLLIIVFGLVSMLTAEPAQGGPGVGFVLFWVGIGGASLALSLWGLAQREHVVLDAQVLTHVRRLGPVRWTRRFARERIEDVRVSPETMSPLDPRAGLRVYGFGGGTVAFDYGDRTVRLADVHESEAKRVVAALTAEGLPAA